MKIKIDMKQIELLARRNLDEKTNLPNLTEIILRELDEYLSDESKETLHKVSKSKTLSYLRKKKMILDAIQASPNVPLEEKEAVDEAIKKLS